MSDSALVVLAQGCPRLRFLNLSGCDKVRFVVYVVCPRFTALCQQGCGPSQVRRPKERMKYMGRVGSSSEVTERCRRLFISGFTARLFARSVVCLCFPRGLISFSWLCDPCIDPCMADHHKRHKAHCQGLPRDGGVESVPLRESSGKTIFGLEEKSCVSPTPPDIPSRFSFLQVL